MSAAESQSLELYLQKNAKDHGLVLILCLSHAHSDTLAFILDTVQLVIHIAKGRNLAISS
jgi:hypothetical protein